MKTIMGSGEYRICRDWICWISKNQVNNSNRNISVYPTKQPFTTNKNGGPDDSCHLWDNRLRTRWRSIPTTCLDALSVHDPSTHIYTPVISVGLCWTVCHKHTGFHTITFNCQSFVFWTVRSSWFLMTAPPARKEKTRKMNSHLNIPHFSQKDQGKSLFTTLW